MAMNRQALAEAKSAEAGARLTHADLPRGGNWITGVRAGALERLHRMGMPSRRDEYWKFTRPEELSRADAIPAELLVTDEKPMFTDIDRLRLVFVDGVFDPGQSDPLEAENIEIETLAEAGARDIHWARDLFASLESRGQSPVERPLATLNTAIAAEGMVIRVTGKVARPVSFHYQRRNPDADAWLRHLVKVETGGDLTLLENGPAAARINSVLEADLADGARLHHVRAQGRDHKRRAATHMFVRLGRESAFKSFTLTVNGALTRNETVIEFLGDDAHATVSGACVGDGAFHQDDTVFITHDAVNCESRQVFKKVLRNGATGVFQGKILVKPDAQKTDGYQISQALLLDEDSQFLAKPELEIYADDVACSHGSTVGAIDEDALFYLMSRGIPRQLAQNMLVLSFLAVALEEVESDALRADIRDRLERWVERHRA